ncbi:hypothetical protein A3860_12035 [Niastella vici]|uniref:SusD/RagB family nutrient-binding outer membrane lipoprotein n=1 Tax=Niastella vici TaxID=1703345 RepID=A0A1V9FG75_9BACT|nr:SusD/RagB family nutrient-binding outer membrane lipoprotein [Niastella vici]OQP57277.1 hypothetical protein A3860_12035 [Niastella vici]
MKKIFIGMIAISVALASCKKSLEKEFPNPENYDKTGNLFAGMFTKTLYAWKLYVQDYGEWWWELQGSGAMGVAAYSQIAHRYITDRYGWFSTYDDLTGTTAFGSDNQQLWQNRLGAFYGSVNTWAVIKDNIATVSGPDLDDNVVYYSLTTVMKDYAALLAVDFYNNIPYSEAFKGKDRVFFPKYDDPGEIYKSVLDELKKISSDLPGQYNKMSVSAKAVFNSQDIAFRGDVNQWVQYINAIRLKFAVRISGVEEAFAKSHIQDVLSKNNLPTSDQVWAMPYALMANSGGEWIRGIGEGWPDTFIPDVIMRRMNRNNTRYEPGIDDPRLPVLAMPTKFSDFVSVPAVGDYRGVNMNADGQKAAYVAGEKYYTGGPYGDLNEHFKQNSRSIYNLATFARNETFPVYMMSLAETDLLLAEIALKNLGTTGKTPDAHIKDAINHSTNFWYTLNQNSPFATTNTLMHPARPSATIINTYADSIAARFNSSVTTEDKMELLMQQKYVHLNLMCPYELWAELRRTRHPKLEPMTFNTKVMKPLPERLRYPTAEQQTNPDNYATVKSQDNFTTPIFWVPAALRNVNPYWDNYNYQ